jgi:MFS transporter, putative metabolite:H+ symporter
MKSNGLSFHHPISFWLGCVAIVAGVLAHVPMFIHASLMDYRMVGMPMDPAMLAGMVVIPLGLLLAAYGLMPRLDLMRQNLHGGHPLHFHIADGVPLNWEHWKLVMVLVVALTVDVMKPATLGFVMPGVTTEYEISNQFAGFLPLVALTGTTVGSILWGRLADSFGRRAAILLSALMFIGTAICGVMPSFEWNLVMCFLMGASAGGLLPITFTLMAEMIPAKHRGWLLVALGGVGTSAGYLVAAGSAALLEPLFSWRVLWLLGLPTGALIIFLDRYIPESPRFLSNAGLKSEARAVLAKFAGVIDQKGQKVSCPDAVPPKDEAGGAIQLMRGAYTNITCGLLVCGVGWGLVNFGFLLWLPTNLRSMGMDASAAGALLARSAFLALPGIALVIWLYHSWSSIRTLVLFILLTTLSLLMFFGMSLAGAQSATAMVAATATLLVSSSGVIAMLIPYAAEIYPVHLRGTGSGLIAASSKFGGIAGAGCGVIGLFGDLAVSALFIAVPMAISAFMLIRSGIDTRGRRLEEIQEAMLKKAKAV